MQTVRAFYQKFGRAKYLSHLDCNRLMQRALKRSGLPVWYTQGFNPHIYITFALPLSLGFESECESMDFRLEEEMPFEAVKEALNRSLPEGMTVYQVALPQNKPEEIRWADYKIALTPKEISCVELRGRLIAFFSQETILMDKKTKKGIKQVDIAPLIHVLHVEIQKEQVVFHMHAPAGNQLNINPSPVLQLFVDQTESALLEINITRMGIYTEKNEAFS